MIKAEAILVNSRGLHARPSSQLAKLAASFQSEIKICKGRRIADATSIASLLMLVAPKDTELTITAKGGDEKKAITAVLELIAGGFGDGVDAPAVAENPPPADAPQPRASQKIDGIGTASGAVIGHAELRLGNDSETPHYAISPNKIAAEVKRFEAAVEQARRELNGICDKVAGMDCADEMLLFVDIYRALLDDPSLIHKIRDRIIADKCNAEWAIKRRVDAVSAQFLNIEDSYFRERGADVRHVMRRLLAAMKPSSKRTHRSQSVKNIIVVAAELDPAHVIVLNQRGYAGFVTEGGGNASHTAILARSLGMPAVVGAKGVLSAAESGDDLILDMDNGAVLVRPEPQTMQHYKTAAAAKIPALPPKFTRGRGIKTRDGEVIKLQANLELPEESAAALSAKVDGVGLFRTEFLFLNREQPPGEDEQFEIYRSVLREFAPLPVVVRTLDLGQDKTGGGMTDSNPLGMRAIRYCLAHPKIFLTQLRALLRAYLEHRNLRILLPMLSHPMELQQTISLIKHAREQLRAGGKMPPPPPLGGMIEVPASVFVMRAFALNLDFFSIGTNDLTQYMLAADRSDERLARYYEEPHPAIIQLLSTIVNNGKRESRPLTLCGEMAGNPRMLAVLLSLGLRHFSMAVPQIARIREMITAADCGKLKRARRRLLTAATPEELSECIDKIRLD